jgi:hypothetical protein
MKWRSPGDAKRAERADAQGTASEIVLRMMERGPNHHRDWTASSKELAAMSKKQVDIASKVVFIADSKTPTGVAEVPLTDIAVEAFRKQIELAAQPQGKKINVFKQF